ncbi:Pre-mRNA-processing factor [Dirofilaria immitis]
MHSYYSRKFGFQIILYVAFAIENTVSLGGILGLKALTGDMPYLGYGNPWITYPRIAYGQADLYYPYSLWGYNRGFWSGYGNRRSIFGGYGNAGIYYPYVQYSYDSPSTSSSLIVPPKLSYSLTNTPRSLNSNTGRYYKGTGNPWITQQ